MAEDWSIDVRKYAPDADLSVISSIVRYLGIALQNRDSSLVAFSDKAETDLVRENYLKKKLGLANPDSELDAAIAAIGARMKADRTKNRVTVYYLLAEHFEKLSVFGGGAAAVEAPVAETSAPGPGPSGTTPNQFAGVGGGAPAPQRSSLMRWLPWLLLALLLIILFLAMKSCKPGGSVAVAPATPETSVPSETPAVAIPTGAGVISEMRADLPALKVYFEVGKSDVSKDLSAAAADLKSYIDAHPKATLSVSGYNDPTGDAAANAALSKRRAQEVAAALTATGIPAGSISLDRPADTTGGGGNAEARRVEVTVKP
jgi:outer membrane protein OmpA-like peptidoglycan-associated protein